MLLTKFMTEIKGDVLSNSSHVNATEGIWWQVKFVSGKVMEPPVNEPLTKHMVIQI